MMVQSMTTTKPTMMQTIMKTKKKIEHQTNDYHYWNNENFIPVILYEKRRSKSSSFWCLLLKYGKQQQWRLLFRQPPMTIIVEQPPVGRRHRCPCSNNNKIPFTTMVAILLFIMMMMIVSVKLSNVKNDYEIFGNVTDLVVAVGQDIRMDCATDLVSKNIQYRWCRIESNDYWNNSNFTNHSSSSSISRNNNHRNCFESIDRYLVTNENQISTVVFTCEIINQTGTVLSRKVFKLYIDQFPMPDDRKFRAKRAIPEPPRRWCRAPRCKPYATVKYAQCSRIELQIRYPSNQYGYNHSLDHWGTIYCNDHIVGYQIWLIGYGIVKKFFPSDPIVLDNLIPGKRYCFNGWAYNSCGSGPVFTLEGVCAQNLPECHSMSDEHCELDFDYSY